VAKTAVCDQETRFSNRSSRSIGRFMWTLWELISLLISVKISAWDTLNGHFGCFIPLQPLNSVPNPFAFISLFFALSQIDLYHIIPINPEVREMKNQILPSDQFFENCQWNRMKANEKPKNFFVSSRITEIQIVKMSQNWFFHFHFQAQIRMEGRFRDCQKNQMTQNWRNRPSPLTIRRYSSIQSLRWKLGLLVGHIWCLCSPDFVVDLTANQHPFYGIAKHLHMCNCFHTII
jgi:hypothetical protein